MIDPLSPKKIEPIRLKPDTLSDSKVGGAPVGAERKPDSGSAKAHLLDISAEAAQKGPPVDMASVDTLRNAIATGDYQVNPRAIASAMLDFVGSGKDDA